MHMTPLPLFYLKGSLLCIQKILIVVLDATTLSASNTSHQILDVIQAPQMKYKPPLKDSSQLLFSDFVGSVEEHCFDVLLRRSRRNISHLDFLEVACILVSIIIH